MGLGGEISCFRPTRFYKGAVPDHGEQAHVSKSKHSEKPKVVTNRIHLSKGGRNLKAPQGPSSSLHQPEIQLIH